MRSHVFVAEFRFARGLEQFFANCSGISSSGGGGGVIIDLASLLSNKCLDFRSAVDRSSLSLIEFNNFDDCCTGKGGVPGDCEIRRFQYTHIIFCSFSGLQTDLIIHIMILYFNRKFIIITLDFLCPA